MSKKEAITCDKCGADLPTWGLKDVSAKITLDEPGRPRGIGHRLDLCLGCYEKFVRFLERG